MRYIKKQNEPIILGHSDFPDIVCQNCGYTVAKRISKDVVKDIISYCPECGEFLE